MRKNEKVTKKRTATYNSVKIDDDFLLPVELNGNTFSNSLQGRYFPFLAPYDNLFKTLLELRLLSPTQSNCINDKTLYAVGAGLQLQDGEFPSEFDQKVNAKNQTMDDVLRGVFESFFQDGNKFIEVVRVNLDGEKFVFANPHNNMDCRLAEPEEGEEPTHVIRSREFRRNGITFLSKQSKPLVIPLWSDSPLQTESVWVKDKKNKNVERTMLHVKNELQGVDHYGMPSNFPGTVQALLEYKSAKFNLDNFANQLYISGILTISGNMTQTEEDNLLRDIRESHTGEGNSQKVFVVTGEEELKTEFTPFQSINEGHFVEFDKHNLNKIINANGWSRFLLDMSEGSALGKGGSFLSELFKIKFRTIILPAQQHVLNNFVYPFMKIMDEFKGTKLYNLPWVIQPVIPVSLEGILDVNSLLTVNEGRAELGKKPLADKTKGEKLISEVKPRSNVGGNGAGGGGEKNQLEVAHVRN